MAQPPLPATARAVRLAAFLHAKTREGAGRMLQEILGISVSTVTSSLRGTDLAGALSELRALLKPETRAAAAAAAELSADDLAAVHGKGREVAELRRQVKVLAEELDRLRDWRTDLVGLAAAPSTAPPIVWQPGTVRAMTWLLCLFDNHLGKRLRRAEVHGLQDYDVAIARARIRRTFERAAELIARDPAPVDRICVVLGGDNCNGELRHDDTASNEIPPMAQARAVAAEANAGIAYLRERFPNAAIIVVAVPGNHGRTTMQPPSVNLAENYDCLAGMFIEARWEADPMVTVHNTGEADAVLDIYGRAYLVTHGDRIGSNGGDGQIGALGPTKRGSLKIAGQWSAVRAYRPDLKRLAAMICGHFHTHWTDREIYSSGAGIGPDPWAHVKLRAKPRPPWQWLLGVDPLKGIVEERTLFVGHPDEGPICAHNAEAD